MFLSLMAPSMFHPTNYNDTDNAEVYDPPKEGKFKESPRNCFGKP